MTILVSTEELAKDVVGAEAMLERHRVNEAVLYFWLSVTC